MRRLTRISIVVTAAMLMALSGGAAVFAQDASDVALDSPIRALELGVNEVRADLDVDFKNFTTERRLVKLTLLDRPEGWDIDIWNRFFDFRITEIVVEPDEDTPGQRPRMRIDLPDGHSQLSARIPILENSFSSSTAFMSLFQSTVSACVRRHMPPPL